MSKKKTPANGKSKVPSVFEMFKTRMRREGRYQEFHDRYMFHRDFGMKHSPAMWQALKDCGYESAKAEKKIWLEHEEKGTNAYHNEKRQEEVEAQQLETELRELALATRDKKFDAMSGIEWVAASFHLEHVTPAECPHIVAWNVLQTAKKYEVAFFKDFLMKALQRGVTEESVSEYAEDETELSELRREVKEAIESD